MERMTLRVASDRTSRSVTTLRRYIRSGRLRADKASGRYGPEYLISESALEAAGLAVGAETGIARRDASPDPIDLRLRDFVPSGLYVELQMKHEQLLVQYGMVRAGALRLFDLQGDLDATRHRLAASESDAASLRERSSREIASIGKKLREAELEIQGKSLEIDALQEKVRGLEQIVRSRGGIAAEKIEMQISQVTDQIRRIERLESRPGLAGGSFGPHPPVDEPGH